MLNKITMYPILEEIVNQVVLEKDLEGKKREMDEFPEVKLFKPFITISREAGSGGRPAAKLLAQALGFKFYDKRIISDVAKSTKLREQLLRRLDEKTRSLIIDWVHSLINPDYVSDVTYMRHLCKVILSAASQGDVVIVGRGANFVTPFNQGLHVRICAPYEVRVRRAVQYEKVERHKARQIIRDVDSDRKGFISQYYGKNISNANYYDLVINSSNMSLDDIKALIILAFKHKFPGYLRQKGIKLPVRKKLTMKKK